MFDLTGTATANIFPSDHTNPSIGNGTDSDEFIYTYTPGVGTPVNEKHEIQYANTVTLKNVPIREYFFTTVQGIRVHFVSIGFFNSTPRYESFYTEFIP